MTIFTIYLFIITEAKIQRKIKNNTVSDIFFSSFNKALTSHSKKVGNYNRFSIIL